MEDHTLFSLEGRLEFMLVRLIILCALLSVVAACSKDVSCNLAQFNLNEGPAVDTLKEAARQANVEFIFSTELVQGLRTPSLEGEYTPIQVFNLLLADSPLVVVQHRESGVFSIQRAEGQSRL